MSVAFVAGATGYTGREVVRELVACGVSVIAHVRPDSTRAGRLREEFAAEGAQFDETPWDAGAMSKTIARLRPDVTFALLGTTRARVRAAAGAGVAEESYASVDYGLTAVLLRAVVGARREGHVSRFIYLSALGAGRPSSNPYYAARFRLEQELRESGLPYVIARPAFITGPDRKETRPGERTAARVLDAALATVGLLGGQRYRDRFASMSGKTLARGLVALALDSTTGNCVAEPPLLRARALS